MKIYRRLTDVEWVGHDLAIRNLYRRPRGLRTIVGVLDQDLIMPWNINFEQADQWGMSSFFTKTEGFHHMGKTPISSLGNANYPANRLQLLWEGNHVFPGAEFYHEVMLEYHGYIKFDVQARVFRDGTMNMEIVKEYFPNLLTREFPYDFTKR